MPQQQIVSGDPLWEPDLNPAWPPETRNTRSEAAVLALALRHPEAADRAASGLGPEDFTQLTTRSTFSIIQRRVRDSEPVDAMSVGHELSDLTDQRDCTYDLADLVRKADGMTPTHITPHIAELKKASLLRQSRAALNRAWELYQAGTQSLGKTVTELDQASRLYRAAVNPPGQWRFATGSTMAAAAAVNERWIIPNLLARDWIVLFAGEPKSGKTTTARELIFSIVQGGTFLRWPVGPPPPGQDKWRVLYLDLDQPESLAFSELKTCAESFGVDPADVGTNRFPLYYGGPEQGPAVTSRSILDEDVRDRIVREMRDKRIDLLVVDVFAKLFSGTTLDESRSTDMNKVHAAIHAIRQETGATVVMLTHLRKTGSEEYARKLKPEDLLNAVRGSGAITGNVDFIWGQGRSTGGCEFIVGRGRSRAVTQDARYPLELLPLDDDGSLFRVTAAEETVDPAEEETLAWMAASEDPSAGVPRTELLDLRLPEPLRGRKLSRRTAQPLDSQTKRTVRRCDDELTAMLNRLEQRRVVAKLKDGRSNRYWLLEHAPDDATCAGVKVADLNNEERTETDES